MSRKRKDDSFTLPCCLKRFHDNLMVSGTDAHDVAAGLLRMLEDDAKDESNTKARDKLETLEWWADLANMFEEKPQHYFFFMLSLLYVERLGREEDAVALYQFLVQGKRRGVQGPGKQVYMSAKDILDLLKAFCDKHMWWKEGEHEFEKLLLLYYLEVQLKDTYSNSYVHEYASTRNVKEGIKNGNVGGDTMRMRIYNDFDFYVEKCAGTIKHIQRADKVHKDILVPVDVYELSDTVARYVTDANFGVSDEQRAPRPPGLSDEQYKVYDVVISDQPRWCQVDAKGGRGKSATAKVVAEYFNVILCLAPTHKALGNMRNWLKQDVGGDVRVDEQGMITVHGRTYIFMTNHRFHFAMPEWIYWTDTPDNDDRMLKVAYPEPDIVILDEISMASMWMFCDALRAGNEWRATVLGLGDHNQLANIGQGFPIEDLKELRQPYEFTKNFRAQYIDLGKFTDSICTGELDWPDDNARVSLRTVESSMDVLAAVVDFLTSFREEKALSVCPWDVPHYVQIVTATNNIRVQINKCVQRFHEICTSSESDTWNDRCFKGDGVVFQKNQRHFKNGDEGLLVSTELVRTDIVSKIVEPEKDKSTKKPAKKKKKQPKQTLTLAHKIVTKSNGTVYIDTDDTLLIKPAYCSTAFKAQASQYDTVIVVMDPSEGKSPAYNRRFFYTAASRAKKRLHIISTNKILSTCCREPTRRRTVMSYVADDLAKELDITLPLAI